MLTSLVTIDRVDICTKLCAIANQTLETQIYIEPTSMLMFYAVHTKALECDHEDAIIAVHDARYGPSVRAPERLIDPINHAIGRVIELHKTNYAISGVVMCGFHQSAIVAYCTSVCVQRILACSNLHATQLPAVYCVTFGMPLYYANPTHCMTECSHIIMQDDWYVLTPFTILLKPVSGLCWIGTEDIVSYVCNKIESMFQTVRSKRTMRDYVNTFVSEYGDVLTTHLETVVVAPPSSPSDSQSVVDDVDWVECVGDSHEA